MIFQCKMCGGDLEINESKSMGTCQYCGSKQTIPKTDDAKIQNLFNRANHYRIKNDFENAMSSYENIVNEDADNAEAYWGLCLCRYGIEYVKDPVTEKMIPTCHRTQFESILEDEDFLNACKKADSVARSSYEEEAKRIDKIQKGILEISSKEEDYDVFICYKEADEMGERTQDSVIGQEIYDALTQKNLHVFFARISLEDKIGTAYEPYIFAALQSAPVMIAIGTKPEYMEAVWVKNEWSRFLEMMKKGAKKTLIPVYKTMNPYDMPEGFASIQAVNMEKIGAMQDLVHGVEKILGKNKKQIVEKVIHVEESHAPQQSYASLLDRAWIFLDDQEWDKADEYAEKVLDLNPKCGEAYLIQMLVELKLDDRIKLSLQTDTFESLDAYKKIVRFGSEELVKEVNGYLRTIKERQEYELQKEKERQENDIRYYKKYLKDIENRLISCKNSIEKLTNLQRELKEERSLVHIKCVEASKEYEKKIRRHEKIVHMRESVADKLVIVVMILFVVLAIVAVSIAAFIGNENHLGTSTTSIIALLFLGVIGAGGYGLYYLYELASKNNSKDAESYKTKLASNYPKMLEYKNKEDELNRRWKESQNEYERLNKERAYLSKELGKTNKKLNRVQRNMEELKD